MTIFARSGFTLAAGLALAVSVAAQEPPSAPPQDTEKGQVVFSSDQALKPADSPDFFPKDPITNAERAAVVILSDDLDLHLTPADAREEAHAILVLKNVSSAPLQRIPLQITSSLRWSSISEIGGKRGLTFTQSPIATDADHTGYAQEAVLALQKPLAVGGTMTLSVFFTGQIPASTSRLELLGTPPEKAAQTDWDQIAQTSDEGSTALRGFGEVLWYPVASPVALLGEGNQLFALVAKQRLLNASAKMRLRLTVVYAGDPPDAAIFDSRVQPLVRHADEENQVVDETHGTATAEFALAPIGFRTPNLFLTAQHPTQTATPLLSVISPVPEAADPYTLAVESLQPLFDAWIAPAPLNPLLLFEHAGAPFEDASFIAAHLSPSAEPANIAPLLVRGLAHAYFAAPGPQNLWLDQGVPEFMSLLWTERVQGRAAALAQLVENSSSIGLGEPDLSVHPDALGTPLTQANSDVLLRLKAAAVLWQLREIVGDDTFRRALAAFRHELSYAPALAGEERGFEKSLDKTAGVDLSWFFNDWVYHDRGLPDLTIAAANPRAILGKGGKSGGYLVAVDVHNDGFAAAEVPVTVRSGSLSATEKLRIGARSTASVRIVFEGTPETVQVGDGSVPEVRTPVHTASIHVRTE